MSMEGMMGVVGDSRSAIFTIEFPDGPVYTGKAVMASLTMDQPAPCLFTDHNTFLSQPPTWEIELLGTGGLTVMTDDELAVTMEEQRAATRWACLYCGRTWPRSHHKCWDGVDGCGAGRPAVYGV